MVACLKLQKINWIPLCLAIEHYNRSNVAPNCTICLNTTCFSYNHPSTNKSVNLPIKQAIAGQRTVRLLLVLNDAHNPINNPTAQIANPRKQNTSLPGNSTTDRHTISHHDGDIISYPLFADADTGIYPHAASQYHARPKAKRGIAMLSVDKFPYPRKLTRGNEFIPCSNNICDILKRFRSFKIPAITLIWPKSSYKHSVTRSYRSGKESGRRSESPLWRHQWRSFVFISHADDVKREIRLHISRLLTNQKRESARSMG